MKGAVLRWACSLEERQLRLGTRVSSVSANGVWEAASVTAAIGLRGCLHLLRRAEMMMTALVFRFLLSLRWTGHAVAQKPAGGFGEKSNMRRKL